MEPLRPIFWGQGMFLQPQHFQQQDEYHDARLRHYFHLFLPFCWGIKSLTLNEPALQNFLFEIAQCEVMTWDGSVVRFGGDALPSTAKIEPRSFEQDLNPSGAPLSIYLGIKRLQVAESNLHTADGSANGEATGDRGHKRFALAETEVSDRYTGGEQTSLLHYLVHEAHILFDVPASRSQDYELVKIAEVQRAADGKGGVLSKRYIPPAITIRSSLLLEGMIKEIRDVLTAKGQELAQYRRQRGQQMTDLGARDLGYLLMTQTVNRAIPLLHHHLEVGDTHPHIVYALLRQLVGELSTFSETSSVLGARPGEEVLPPYRHDQLWPCFDLVTRRVKELLNELTTVPVGDVLLRHENEFFTADLEPPFFAGDNRYYLAIKSDLTPAQLFRLLQDTGKITSREEMPKLQKSFLFGLKIDALDTPPQELLMRAHYRYFIIDRRSDHWQKIEQQKNIAVYCTALPPETEMRLLVIYGGK